MRFRSLRPYGSGCCNTRRPACSTIIGASPEVRRAWIRHVPMRRYAKPEEIAGTAQFLLDETSSGYLTGEIIAVDGGFRGAGMMME